MEPHTDSRVTRRQLLVRVGAAAAALAVGHGLRSPQLAEAQGFGAGLTFGAHHLAWQWLFQEDGTPEDIRVKLAPHRMGLVVKTHDATQWMARYDNSPFAVTGVDQIARLSAFFEEGGVPFHAWCVVRGLDPLAEADMAAQVLASGVRSLVLDLEPHPGFWLATPREAVLFGDSLRQRFPNATIVTSIDPRPWQLREIPLAEFAAFSNALAPQLYWDEFNSPENWSRFAAEGYVPGPAGITPRFLVDTAVAELEQYGLPVYPIGQGSAAGTDTWPAFLDQAFRQDAEAVSVWRYGVTEDAVWELLGNNPPRQRTYVIEPGDTLSYLALVWGTEVETIVAVNGITDPNHIQVGQVLIIPGSGAAGVQPVTERLRYVVAPGDNLTWLAERWGTTVERIMEVNGITNPDRIYVGTELLIP